MFVIGHFHKVRGGVDGFEKHKVSPKGHLQELTCTTATCSESCFCMEVLETLALGLQIPK